MPDGCKRSPCCTTRYPGGTAIPKKWLLPPPQPQGTRLLLPQAQQGQLHFPEKRTFSYHIVLTLHKFPVRQQSGCWSLNKPLYRRCSLVLTQSETKLFKTGILLSKRQTRKGIMTFKFTVNLFLLNLLSKYLLGNSLSLSEAPACLLPNSSSSVTPTISNTIEINGIRLQAEVEKV